MALKDAKNSDPNAIFEEEPFRPGGEVAPKPEGKPPATKVGDMEPVGGSADPFSLDNVSVSGTTIEDLGVEQPILIVPVDKPNKQDFFRVHPDPAFKLEARVIKLDAERETFLVTRAIWPLIPGETKLVRLVAYLPRTGGIGLWPVLLPDPLAQGRDSNWSITARKAAELAENKWVRLQANMARGAYDVVTSDKIPPPVWPNVTMRELLSIAFGDGRLVDRPDHPVIRQLRGE
jgi:hypothetical protein